MGDKIIELQGLRCIAIISVLLFHIWPDVFGNGFLGVDIFFVISGYIMAVVLLSSNSLKESFFKTTLTFYYRRIYRILPLYLINILITILFVPLLSFTALYFNFLSQIKSALTFSTNFAMLFEEVNYFDHTLSFNGFKHYWSLCVEIQFYAIVPLILYCSARLKLFPSLFFLWPLMIGASMFSIFYMLINYAQSPSNGNNGAQFTFTMLPARMYEFVAGFVAFHAQQAIDLYFHDDQKVMSEVKKVLNNVITTNILTAALFIITLFPIKLIDIYTLPATIILTSALIITIGRSKRKNEMKYSLLANKFCIFVGDASYSLYIFHWIINVLGKAVYGDDIQQCLFILIACMSIGVAVHLFIEKPIVKARLKPKIFFPWIAAAYFVTGCVIFTVDFSQPISMTTRELFHSKSELIGNTAAWKEISSHISPEISAELAVFSWKEDCNYNDGDQWKGSGTLKVAIIGNSHSLCSVAGVKLAMKGMYSHLKLFEAFGITPFEGFRYANHLSELRQNVTDFKPDIIYLIFKYMEDFEDPPTALLDIKVHRMQEMIDFLSSNSKVLFISKMHFNVPNFSSLKFAEQVYHNGFTKNYQVKQSDIEDSHVVSTRRWEQTKCKNCIFIDMLEAFCKNGWCSPLDESGKVPLIFDNNHVNKLGSHLLGFHFQKYFNQMYKLLNASSNV